MPTHFILPRERKGRLQVIIESAEIKRVTPNTDLEEKKRVIPVEKRPSLYSRTCPVVIHKSFVFHTPAF